MPAQRRLYVRISSGLESEQYKDPLTDLTYVNDDFHPVIINNHYFSGQGVFRVKDFSGHTPTKDGAQLPNISNSEYFENRTRRFSLQIQGRFKHEWDGDEVLFGTFLKNPIPFNLFTSNLAKAAIIAAKFIDPAIDGDLCAQEPFLCSPLLCGMNTSTEINKVESLSLPGWNFGGNSILSENLLSENDCSGAENSEIDSRHRRQYFLSPANRCTFRFSPDKIYGFEFASRHADLNELKITFGGLSIGIETIVRDQPIIYEARNRSGRAIFWRLELGFF